jgi:hypothetical protein
VGQSESAQLLERQALVPLFGDNPVEMGMAGMRAASCSQRLRRGPRISARCSRLRFPTENGEIIAGDADPRAGRLPAHADFGEQRPTTSSSTAGDDKAMSEGGEARRRAVLLAPAGMLSLPFGLQLHRQHPPCALDLHRIGFHNNGLYNLNGNRDCIRPPAIGSASSPASR